MALSDVFFFLCAENVHANKIIRIFAPYMPTVLSRHMAGSHCPAWMTTGSGMPPYPYLNLFLS